MKTLTLYNTLGRKREVFKPLHDKKVGMYSCGLTVYNFAHIGNLRAYIVADVLKRVLLMDGYTVKHVMNITDVGHLTDDADTGEDKVEKTVEDMLFYVCSNCKKETPSFVACDRKVFDSLIFHDNYIVCLHCGHTNTVKKEDLYYKEKLTRPVNAYEITKRYTEAFLKDLAALHVLPVDKMPKATNHITGQTKLIKKLESKGYTYKTSDGVYFDTSKVADYGKLANLQNQSLREGARVAKNDEKRNPSDFALWKFSPQNKKRQMEWSSPWGTGFPGWHIECSAMSMEYLGESFDIHTGGIDHIPVHHTNEIAQSEAATGKPFVKYWVHNEFLLTENQKMAKSAENFLTLQALMNKGYPPLAYRYFVLNTHYRKPLSFNWDALTAAQKAYETLIGRLQMMPKPKGKVPEYEDAFVDAVNDDLNIPKALGILWDMLKSPEPEAAKHAALDRFDAVLGLGLADVKAITIPEEIRTLADEREKARQKKDFAAADALRDKIQKAGFAVDDTEAGPILKKQTRASQRRS